MTRGRVVSAAATPATTPPTPAAHRSIHWPGHQVDRPAGACANGTGGDVGEEIRPGPPTGQRSRGIVGGATADPGDGEFRVRGVVTCL